MSVDYYPLVTVITPCRNSVAYIEQTILSVINQTYRNVEFIIVDGGSTDGTLDIVKKYEKSIQCTISEPDEGMYQAINKGLRRATGDIIAYLNSDDLYYPETLAKVVHCFYLHSAADLIYGKLDFINHASCRIFTLSYPTFNPKYFPLVNYCMIGQPASFWRASLLARVGAFDETLKMASDFDFYIRAGRCGKLLFLSDTLAAFRIHGGSLTQTQNERAQAEVDIINSRYCDGSPSIIRFVRSRIYQGYFKVINVKAMLSKMMMRIGAV